MALEDPDLPLDMRADFVARSRFETERLEALIDDILFLSELEAAQGDPSGERSDMGAIAQVVVDELQGEAAEQAVAGGLRLPRRIGRRMICITAHYKTAASSRH